MTKPRKDRPMVTCPQCRGVGQVPKPPPEEGMKPCILCNGSGKVPG